MSTLSGGPNIVTDGLVLYLDAANPSSYVSGSTAWNDLTRNNYNTALINGPSYDSGNMGSIAFDGIDDYMIRTDSSLNLYTSLTVSFWRYLTTYTRAWETYVSYNAEEGGLTQGWGIRRQSTTDNYQVWGAGGSATLYRNGQLISTTGTNTTGSWQMITLTVSNMTTFGTNNRLTMPTRSDSLNSWANMRVNLFSLYSRVLTTAEIEQNYNTTKSRFNL
jgi:hypothetical protein